MSKEDRKIAKFQVGFGYWIVFCLIYGLTKLNCILISKMVICMHLVSDFKISLMTNCRKSLDFNPGMNRRKQ